MSTRFLFSRSMALAWLARVSGKQPAVSFAPDVRRADRPVRLHIFFFGFQKATCSAVAPGLNPQAPVHEVTANAGTCIRGGRGALGSRNLSIGFEMFQHPHLRWGRFQKGCRMFQEFSVSIRPERSECATTCDSHRRN
jgi:hypothetical protein